MEKKKKKSETTIESRNHETIERFTKINVICIGILSSDLQLVLPVKKKGMVNIHVIPKVYLKHS